MGEPAWLGAKLVKPLERYAVLVSQEPLNATDPVASLSHLNAGLLSDLAAAPKSFAYRVIMQRPFVALFERNPVAVEPLLRSKRRIV
jgi:hypothetical protein